MTYKIKGGPVGSDRVWNVVDADGEVVASLHGPMSAVVALLATEALNTKKRDAFDGWTKRLDELLVKEDEDEN